jgi:hypothetical protein
VRPVLVLIPELGKRVVKARPASCNETIVQSKVVRRHHCLNSLLSVFFGVGGRREVDRPVPSVH